MKKYLFTLLLFLAALSACRQEKSKSIIVKDPYYQKAEFFYNHHNDSAFYYFNKAAGNSKDSLQIAMAYNWMAGIQSDAGDYFGSQESLSLSLRYLSEEKDKDHTCMAADYNEFGMNSFNLRNYTAAIASYEQAIRLTSDPGWKAVFYNNQANAYQKNKNYEQALRLYNAATALQKSSPSERAMILTNMAMTKWLNQPAYLAAPDLRKALHIRLMAQDRWGENSSYVHLTEYYTRSNPDSALYYAHKMYGVATLIKSPDDRLDALQKLISLSPAPTSKLYFTLYQVLNDSLQTARNAAKNQFALIRYDTEKSKADNLKLQKDNTENKYQIARQQVILGAILFFVLSGIIITVIWLRKRKERMLLETRNVIQDNELRLSKKIHDVVANGLYRVMKEIQYQDIDQDSLVGRIDHLYQQSRDISHEVPKPSGDFQRSIAELVQSFATDHTRVLLVGHSEATWENVNARIRSELEAVLQELMVNMSKHSLAGNVVIRFARDPQQLRVTYTDDGRGLPAVLPQGNGLKNTGNRIRGIGGYINFEPNGARGLRVTISIPTA